MTVDDDKAINLTALAYRLRSDQAMCMLPVFKHSALSATILRTDAGDQLEEELAPTDIIYVVIAGFGHLGGGDARDIEVAAGDVLFVPARCARKFIKLSRKFQVWRLVLQPPSMP